MAIFKKSGDKEAVAPCGIDEEVNEKPDRRDASPVCGKSFFYFIIFIYLFYKS